MLDVHAATYSGFENANQEVVYFKVTDDPLMKVIKSKVLSKFDDRFREINAGKLHQILDPETEGLVPRHKATIILETAAK